MTHAMFDSPPANLPLEPKGTAPTPPPPPAPRPAVPPRMEGSVSAPMPTPPPPPTMPVPGRTSRKEPEDIFSGLDLEDPGQNPPAGLSPERASHSIMKPLLLVLGLVIVVAGAGAGLWWFFIREPAPAPSIVQRESNVPSVVTSEAEPVVEIPPTLGTQPVTQPPDGTNVPLPGSVTSSDDTPVVLAEPVPAPDRDFDGLTDIEEDLFGTIATSADSDGDGFNDGIEVQNGYDPAFAGAKLTDSVRFIQTSVGSRWASHLPANWVVGIDPDAPSDFRIQAGTLATFSIRITPKPDGMTFEDWRIANDPAVDAAALLTGRTSSGLEIKRSIDGRLIYVIAPTEVVSLRYVLNGAPTIEYPVIFSHIAQSLRLL